MRDLVDAQLPRPYWVALAYRDRSDPSGEISLATPTAGLRLVAMRALVVAGVALPLAFVVLAAYDHWAAAVPIQAAVAWCLPGAALAALAVVQIPFLTAMGLAAAGTVLVAVLVALTLVPAGLGLLKGKAFAGRVRREHPKRDADGRLLNNGASLFLRRF